ncbi:leucine-rich repeat-containing protein 37A-like isoform X2 [Balaenoptera acutorostrata]|uniref:Leucine-rich repeat-containing protein 37A-like isoform X2 n=1 Tax=Balaenoptera acutorostrata TaxID=9767 RepID=A0ABM3SMR1_BALAC|nr:leucine-rich repeat-containing protein 37A-like isoform X2 [Balaenoptera acutorostrata]
MKRRVRKVRPHTRQPQIFSQFGLLYSVRVFPNAAVAGPVFYAIIEVYSARDAHRAQKACDQKQLFQTSPVKIYSHRIAKGEDKKRSRRGFFRFLLRKRSSGESESQEGFFGRRRPLWLRDVYRPLNATRKENMAQKLHDRESSDEDEMYFYKDVP